MKLIWHCHACFELISADGSVVFDPYSPGSVRGLKLKPLHADCVICSHGHSDHNYASGVEPSGRPRACALRIWVIWDTRSIPKPRQSSSRLTFS